MVSIKTIVFGFCALAITLVLLATNAKAPVSDAWEQQLPPSPRATAAAADEGSSHEHHHHDASEPPHEAPHKDDEAKQQAPSLTPPPPPPPLTTAAPNGLAELKKQLIAGTFTPTHMETLSKLTGEERPAFTFGKNPSLQEAFDAIRRNFDSRSSVPADALNIIPLLGLTCTKVDFFLMLNLVFTLDVQVTRYHITVNGPGKLARFFAETAAEAFPGFVSISLYDQNQGVSRGWNVATKLAFVDTVPPLRSVMIANSDVEFARGGQLAAAMKHFHEHPTFLLARFNDFAFFGVRREGFEKLGYFDENLYPGYGEDVEIHLRMVSLGVGSNDYLGHLNSMAPSTHYTSPNVKHDSVVGRQFHRNIQFPYMMQKWGVDMHMYTDYQHASPFKHPYNNPKIRHTNSWALDPVFRACLINPDSHGCSFNVGVTKVLEDQAIQTQV